MPISKNRRKNKKKPLSAVKKEKEALALPPIPDRRALESTMAQLTGRLFAGDWEGADDPVSGTQDLVYEAWETPSKRARVKLARQALEVSGSRCRKPRRLTTPSAPKTKPSSTSSKTEKTGPPPRAP